MPCRLLLVQVSSLRRLAVFRALEGEAIALETTQSEAQEARDTFFDSGAGVSFARQHRD